MSATARLVADYNSERARQLPYLDHKCLYLAALLDIQLDTFLHRSSHRQLLLLLIVLSVQSHLFTHHLNMHLPPLDVAVYPVVPLSYGGHGGSHAHHPSRPANHHGPTAPDFSSIQKAIQRIFRSSRITIHQVERIRGRLHQVYLTRLADGNTLVLKCPPDQSTRALRHEKHGLETERKTLETLHEFTQLSVPKVLKYDSHGGSLGSPFLLTSYISGRTLPEISRYLSASQRDIIQRTLGAYVRTLTALSASQFGTTERVFAKKGSKSWREAFLKLLESALRDSEDMLVTLPYDSIRYYVGQRYGHFLDEVTEPRLVALGVCEPQNVLINEHTKEVAGLVGFSDVIWGDPLMSGGIAGGSDAFFEGYGERPLQSAGVQARLLM
jgi:aminoglycoside phosphotransferase (APT) family kinase protein